MLENIKRAGGAVIAGAASVQENDNRLIDALFEIISIADFTAHNKSELLLLGDTKRSREKAERIKTALHITAETDRTLRQEVTSMTHDHVFNKEPSALKKASGTQALPDSYLSEILFFMRHHPVVFLRSARLETFSHERILRFELGLHVEDSVQASDDTTVSSSLRFSDNAGYQATAADITRAINNVAELALKRHLELLAKQDTILPLVRAIVSLRDNVIEKGKQEDSESSLICALTPDAVAASQFVIASDAALQEMRDCVTSKILPLYADILRPYGSRSRKKA